MSLHTSGPSTVLVALMLLAVACKRSDGPAPTAVPQAAGAAPAAGQVIRGKILERIDVAPYSYLRIAGEAGEIWAAVPKTDEAVGEEVQILNSFPMTRFQSKELGRTFPVVHFGALADKGRRAGPGSAKATAPSSVPTGDAKRPAQADPGAQHRGAMTGPSDVKVAKVPRATGPGARTVEELWAERASLAGKVVVVRGQIVKATAVMGKYFLHLRDGTGKADARTNDVTVSSSSNPPVGGIVTVKGAVAIDKDLGSGLVYPVLIENAEIGE